MKKGFTILALVSSLFLGTTLVQAQSGLKTANKQYTNLAYSEAITTYEQIANRGFVDADLLKHLGNSYYFNGDYKSANEWYKRLYNEFSANEIEPEYDYRYAQTLKNVGLNEEAKIYLDKFASIDASSIRAGLIKKGMNSMSEIEKNSGRYTIKRLAINSPYTDYPNSVHDDKLMFTSARDTGNFTKRVFTWTGDAFTKLYESEISEDGLLGKPSKLSSRIDTKYNESGSVLTKDGKTIYFTRNNYNEGKRGKNSEFITLLKIYRAEFKNGKWTNVTELPFNSNQFSTAHPVLNDAEDMLYFVSDRPGGYGSSDIWRVKINGLGFGKPENLGPTINTDGRETFPFINSNNELYFSSDGRPGLGGLDVYAVKMEVNGSFIKVLNVGAPVNSSSDDFAYILDSKNKTGFFASNRSGGYGKDDIFSFTELRALEFDCIQKLRVIVMDSKTENIITKATVNAYDLNGSMHGAGVLEDNCQYIFADSKDCGKTVKIEALMQGYQPGEATITLGTESGETTATIMLNPIKKKKKIQKNDDLFKVLNLEPIYFDFDKDNIRPDAAIELAKIVEAMKEDPNMKIDVRSFTDSRGSSAYNMKLSERRAKSTAEWIISHGISSNRVSYKGYGDTQLLNDCKKGVKCTEAQQQENRRSEFIVIDL